MGRSVARATVAVLVVAQVTAGCGLLGDPPVVAWSHDCAGRVMQADLELGGVSALAQRRAWTACMREAGATCSTSDVGGGTAECQATRGGTTVSVSSPW